MMAARAGAEAVYACEMFATLAELAGRITEANVPGKVHVIPKLSSEMTVGPTGDMPQRADILITEIFDSALLGEALLPSVSETRDGITSFSLPLFLMVYAPLCRIHTCAGTTCAGPPTRAGRARGSGECSCVSET